VLSVWIEESGFPSEAITLDRGRKDSVAVAVAVAAAAAAVHMLACCWRHLLRHQRHLLLRGSTLLAVCGGLLLANQARVSLKAKDLSLVLDQSPISFIQEEAVESHGRFNGRVNATIMECRNL